MKKKTTRWIMNLGFFNVLKLILKKIKIVLTKTPKDQKSTASLYN